MNDHQQANDEKLLKNKLIKINPVDIYSPAVKSIAEIPVVVPKKKNKESKDEPSFYNELHYGNYE